jgi:malonyl-CoA/methylmalonyl-CoA synthetase
MSENLYARLAAAFPQDRGQPAFITSDGVITYADLEAGVGCLAALLLSKGVAPGDRIAVQAPKSVEMVMLYLATLQVGAIFVPLNTAYTEAEVGYFLGDAEPALFVTDAAALAGEASQLAAHTAIHPSAPADTAAIIYTSGTTGRSKGAMLSHGALAANAAALRDAWGVTADDVLLHALPIFHVHGLFIALHTILIAGGSMIWQARFDDAEALAALPQATLMMGVPTFYTRLLANPGFTRETTANVRLFVCGSAPLLESTFAEFEARTGQRILERYGMSEAVVITSNPLDGERVAGSVGFPLPGVDLRIGDGEAVGVIEIRGPSVFTAYWRMPDKTAEEFTPDGWFKTGDVGHVDPDGRVWISGRAKDLIISGGFNVYPKEIELVIDELPGVTESAVIGVPHPDLGEGVVAVVTGDADPAAILAGVRAKLAGFKTPKKVVFIDDLPRNAMGKVQKNLLRDTYGKLFES